MNLKLVLLLALIASGPFAYGQNDPAWDNWNWLIGHWTGEGQGQPGSGGGTFSFSPDLDENILVRHSHSEYPAPGNEAPLIHRDLLIVYVAPGSSAPEAIYFDNEGHVINYQVSYGENSIVLTSERDPNFGVFRLSYTLLDRESVYTKFEMSSDGINYMTYIEGKSRRTN